MQTIYWMRPKSDCNIKFLKKLTSNQYRTTNFINFKISFGVGFPHNFNPNLQEVYTFKAPDVQDVLLKRTGEDSFLI